jgi:tetratricopeptide (TPR) repeat protein
MSMPPSSRTNGVQWVLKSPYGDESGPHSTEVIIQMISQGNLHGNERIKKYPYGKWIEISRQGEFYDSLLKVLEDSVGSGQQGKRKIPSLPSLPTQIVQAPQKNEETQVPASAPPTFEVAPLKANEPPPQGPDLLPRNQESPSMIDLPVPVNGDKDYFKKRALVAAAVVLSAVLFAVTYFMDDLSALDKNKLHLVVPKATTKASLSSEKVKELFRQAITGYLLDSFEGYLASENILVSVIEGDPYNVEARGFLCLVYKEMWPFVTQDSQDLDAVHLLTNNTRLKDPVGINGIYCEVTRLLILGKYKDARGVLENSLNQPSLSAAPVLYNLKAEILAGDRDPQKAVNNADRARALWPEWVKPQFDLAQYYNQSGQYSQALQAYQLTLKINPKHKNAQIEMANLQYRIYHQAEAATSLLVSALSSKDKVQRVVEAKAYLVLAEISFDSRDPDKALQYAKKAYELYPGEFRAKDLIIRLGGVSKIPQKASQTSEIVFIGDQYARGGDCLAAQAEYKTAYELDPTNGIAAYKAGKCLWQLNQSQDAINWLSKAIAADPKLVSAYVLQADFYSQRYNYSNAMQVLNRASQQFNNNYEILRGYGLIEYRRNNLKEAAGFLQRSYKVYGNDVETLILLAKIKGGLREYREAMQYALRAIEIDGTNNEAQITYAKVLSQMDGVDAGISYLRDLISKFAYTLDFRIGLAELYRESERYKIAKDMFEQIIEADNRNKKAYLGLGESLQVQGLFDKALGAYLSAAILDPSDAEGVFRAGLVYLEKDKYQDAITQFQRALKINPLFPRLNYYMGRAYFQNANYDMALQAALAERKTNPNLADSFLLAAEVYAATKQYAKCADEYQGAIKLRPQGAELYVKMAKCYRLGGSSDIAASMLDIAMNQESGLADIYKEQGAIYETKGDISSAVAAYNKYLALSPNAPDLKEIESQILKLSSGRR